MLHWQQNKPKVSSLKELLTDGPGEGAGAGTPTTDVGASEMLGASAGAPFAGAGAGTGAGAAALPPLTTTSSFWPPWQCDPCPSTTLKQAK